MEIERRTVKINLQIAPLIDIIFNLLLFFMLSYQVSAGAGIKITLPAAKTAQPQREKNVVISVTEDNRIFLNEQEVNIELLNDILKEKLETNLKKTVILRADEKIDLGLAVQVMDIAKQAGAEGLVISTEAEEDVK